MVNKITTRIQSRLSRKGLRVTLGDIKAVYSEMVLDPQNPTDEEVNAVTEYFVNQLAPTPQPENQTEEKTIVLIDTALEHQPEEATAPIDSEVQEQEDIAPLGTIPQLKTDEPQSIFQPEPEETAITLQEKSELVASTANDMGITLSIEEVTAIAENFDYASVNSDYEIAEIESAITAFIQHKAQVTKQKITNMVQGVRETVTRLDNENSQLLNDGLREINNNIKRGSQKFKSQVRTAIKAFALPPSKTG
jgi:hypothetical protein